MSSNEQPFPARFPYRAPPNQGNQPRPANSPAQRSEDVGFPIVDEAGKLVRTFGSSKSAK